MIIDYLHITTFQLVVLSLFAIAFVIQLVYYFGLFGRVAFYKRKVADLNNVSQEGVSVVICAKNESDKLRQLLPKILEQGHPVFEVVVVNNCSTDESDEVLAVLKQKYNHLVIRNIELDKIFVHNNAMAWGLGIKAAKYDWVVLTDANCFPANENWLAALQQNFRKGIDVVLSYTSMQKNRFVRADNCYDALYYLSKALAGKPYTASGTNLAFRKHLFFDNPQFYGSLKVRDKGDRVFVNSIVKPDNTAIDLSYDAVNTSTLKLNFEEWHLKRRDEIRSQRLFRKGEQYAGFAELLARAVFYALFVVALIYTLNVEWAWIAVVSAFGVRLCTQVLIFVKAQKRFKEKGLLFMSLMWDVLSLITYIPVLIASRVQRRVRF